MNFAKELKKLDLPVGSFMIVGSGLLDVLGIRASHDIDVVISKESFDILKQRGWEIVVREDGTEKIIHESFDCMTDWYGKSLAAILDDAQWVNDIPYMSLSTIYSWKKSMKRSKDLVDLQLIDEYLSRIDA
jgi:hypothetical protein